MEFAQAQDIAGYNRRRYRTVNRKRPFVFTPSHDTILKDAINRYHLLTSEQITRLLYSSGTIKTVKAYLTAMTDVRLTQSLSLPTVRGRRPHLYFLGTLGRKALRDEDIDIPIYFEQADLQTRSYGWLMHLLETNDFLISGATLEKTIPEIHLEE
jgi:Replication-relaxation